LKFYEITIALQWLCDANLTYKISRSTAPGLPIAAYDDLLNIPLFMTDYADKLIGMALKQLENDS
jgi:hypothetical protein